MASAAVQAPTGKRRRTATVPASARLAGRTAALPKALAEPASRRAVSAPSISHG
jgi:hypothetical protein